MQTIDLPADTSELEPLFNLDDLRTFIDELKAGNLEKVLSIPCPVEKLDRSKIHGAIRTHLPFLQSSTNSTSFNIDLYYKEGVTSGRKHKKLGLDPRG